MILSLLGRRTIVTYKPPKSKLGGGKQNNDNLVKITEPDDAAIRGKSPRNINFLGRMDKLSKWIPTTSNVYGKHTKDLESDE